MKDKIVTKEMIEQFYHDVDYILNSYLKKKLVNDSEGKDKTQASPIQENENSTSDSSGGQTC